METGVDIKDKDMQLFISTTCQITPTQQARNRIRNDVDVVILKTKNKPIPDNLGLTLDEKWLNKPLTSDDIKRLIIELNIKDGKGELMGISKLYSILKYNEYTINKKKVTIDNKRVNVTIIQ